MIHSVAFGHASLGTALDQRKKLHDDRLRQYFWRKNPWVNAIVQKRVRRSPATRRRRESGGGCSSTRRRGSRRRVPSRSAGGGGDPPDGGDPEPGEKPRRALLLLLIFFVLCSVAEGSIVSTDAQAQGPTLPAAADGRHGERCRLRAPAERRERVQDFLTCIGLGAYSPEGIGELFMDQRARRLTRKQKADVALYQALVAISARGRRSQPSSQESLVLRRLAELGPGAVDELRSLRGNILQLNLAGAERVEIFRRATHFEWPQAARRRARSSASASRSRRAPRSPGSRRRGSRRVPSRSAGGGGSGDPPDSDSAEPALGRQASGAPARLSPGKDLPDTLRVAGRDRGGA
jgi:hypothetical protein